jgi:hypothetical protein
LPTAGVRIHAMPANSIAPGRFRTQRCV